METPVISALALSSSVPKAKYLVNPNILEPAPKVVTLSTVCFGSQSSDECMILAFGGLVWYIGGYWGFSTESKTPVTFVLPIGCWPLEMPALALKFVLKPQSLPALYQTKPPNAGIMLTPVT